MCIRDRYQRRVRDVNWDPRSMMMRWAHIFVVVYILVVSVGCVYGVENELPYKGVAGVNGGVDAGAPPFYSTPRNKVGPAFNYRDTTIQDPFRFGADEPCILGARGYRGVPGPTGDQGRIGDRGIPATFDTNVKISQMSVAFDEGDINGFISSNAQVDIPYTNVTEITTYIRLELFCVGLPCDGPSVVTGHFRYSGSALQPFRVLMNPDKSYGASNLVWIEHDETTAGAPRSLIIELDSAFSGSVYDMTWRGSIVGVEYAQTPVV
eukprot:TRINITY_DN1138_c0_g1_i1.p1 TRINITY_DN1138_c0_g1~~TRINITY_DN1138_c0_g1_i1.p1  ORF type:complete len:265 (+),score=13.63 TRINITY_DN1138_c0_g1_i1:44-838(+)